MLLPFPCGVNDGFSLVSKLGRELPVRGHHLCSRMNLLAIAG
jgi:hypothetical protein